MRASSRGLHANRCRAAGSPDFVHDQFAGGQRFRGLNVVDDVTRECLAAIPDTSIPGPRVARELTALTERRGKPGTIVSDNGTELTSNAILVRRELGCPDCLTIAVCQYASGLTALRCDFPWQKNVDTVDLVIRDAGECVSQPCLRSTPFSFAVSIKV